MNFELCLQAGSYNWLTYEDVYKTTIKIGSAIRSRGVNPMSASPLKSLNYSQNILLSFEHNSNI